MSLSAFTLKLALLFIIEFILLGEISSLALELLDLLDFDFGDCIRGLFVAAPGGEFCCGCWRCTRATAVTGTLGGDLLRGRGAPAGELLPDEDDPGGGDFGEFFAGVKFGIGGDLRIGNGKSRTSYKYASCIKFET